MRANNCALPWPWTLNPPNESQSYKWLAVGAVGKLGDTPTIRTRSCGDNTGSHSLQAYSATTWCLSSSPFIGWAQFSYLQTQTPTNSSHIQFHFSFFFLGIKQILRLYSTSNHKKIMIKITVIMMMSKITVKRGHYKEDKVHINRDLPCYSWGCELAMEPHGNNENFCNIQGRLLDPCLEDCFGYPPPKVGKR